MLYRIRDVNPEGNTDEKLESLVIGYLQGFGITGKAVKHRGSFLDIRTNREINSDCIIALNEAGFWVYKPAANDSWLVKV